MNERINIGLVEDHILFRQGMKAILGNWKNLEVVFESAEGYTVVDKLKAAEVLPHVMLVDLSLPPHNDTEFSGREVVLALQQHFPDIKVIILSAHRDENFISQLIEMGAHGYLVKDCDPQEVYDAVSAVYSKGSYINEQALRALQAKAKRKPNSTRFTESLSKRELEVLELICKQHTSEEIAERLFISVKTVNGHRINLLEKTGAKNIAGLVIYAIKNDVIQLV